MNSVIKIFLSLSIAFFFSGCASQSAKMAHKIQNDKDGKFSEVSSNNCKTAISQTQKEDLLFNGRMITTPIIGVLGLFSAPLILAANVSLDVKDRLSASDMSESCGGEPIGNKKIAQDVAVNGSLGFLLQGTNLSVYPGGEEVPVSTAAEAASN
ncbi:MAG: hypothetical protein CFH34_01676 [Alphaproteobacteria bacterium MarineAlpha9_Bin4]|mgnify:CR=1 FL=1|nr:hypothetical protein [Pelagibacterales bacterium]PPR24841.1 MAG: hypothetical protein CFH34_01676 [Alphaproteobacteria bacterium MarineAlpha9_Bin4]